MSYAQKGFIVLGLAFFFLFIALMFKAENEAMEKKELAESIETKAKSLNERIEIKTKKNVKRFVLTEKEMYALRLLVGPMGQFEMADIMKQSYEVKRNDNLLDLTDTLQKVYLEAGIGLNPNS